MTEDTEICGATVEHQRKNRPTRERSITKPTETETQNKIRSCLSKEFIVKAPPWSN
ncbi:hypothetical protein HMPREF9374_2232 [Desmospora sp. 8437]|nr:hypothetical protein HMPREF9374_2232 [Desmospora sp. 8437]